MNDAPPTEHPPPPPPAAAAPPVGLTLGALVTVTLGPAVGETEGAPVTVGAAVTVGSTVGVGVDSSGTAVTMLDVPSCSPPTMTSANQYCSPPVRSVMVTFDVVLVRFKPVTVL